MIGNDLVKTIRKFMFEKQVNFVLNLNFDDPNISFLARLDGWRWCKCQQCRRSSSVQGT